MSDLHVIGAPDVKGHPGLVAGSPTHRAFTVFRALCPDVTEVWVNCWDGPPVAKERPRTLSNGHTYSPGAADEEATGYMLARQFKEPLEGNVALGCVFYLPTLRRIDKDNLEKHVLDAGNGVVWKDDSQVTGGVQVLELDRVRPRTVVFVAGHVSSLVRGTGQKAML